MRQPPERRFVRPLRFPALTRFYDTATLEETKLKGTLALYRARVPSTGP